MTNAAARADVHVFDDEHVLHERVARYLADGLAAGEQLLVIATAARRDDIAGRLTELGHDLTAARARGQVAIHDADEMIANVMLGGEPSRDRFVEHVGGALDRARSGRAGAVVRAYGELADVLWQAGKRSSALQLERWWNELASGRSLVLRRAYVMGGFCSLADRDDVQRTHTLEHELAQHRELVAALREALEGEHAARLRAERAHHFNELFAGSLGHDLRNPLSTITIGASHIARSSDEPRTTRAAARIVSSAERMRRMIEQLLDLTRLRIGHGLDLACRRTDLGKVWRTVVDELAPSQSPGRIGVTVHDDAHGDWDPDRLAQVASNLVHNAIVHGTSESSVAIEIDGSVRDRVTASVHNDGVVPPEILPGMFEPFRGTAYKRAHGQGLGLGLYLTQQIVLAHGGTIDVLSTEADGTTVRLCLPR
ncbi:MAG TPA: ATP-binding protein [Kofleriaceae bacterium]|jgi:signal transduction histidine kinase